MARKVKYPVVPLRGITILPGTIMHFDLNRFKSIKAVEKAMLKNQMVFVVTQRDSEINEPTYDDLYNMGVVSKIKQVVKLPNNVVRVLVEGINRARLFSIEEDDGYCIASVEVIPKNEEILDVEGADEEVSPEEAARRLSENAELTAMVRTLKDQLKTYASYHPNMSKALEKQFENSDSLTELLDYIAINLPMSVVDRQSLLDAVELKERFSVLMSIFEREIKVLDVRKELQQHIKEKVDKNQKEYILREQIKLIRQELGEDDSGDDVEQFKKEVEKLKASKEVKDKIKKEIDRYSRISTNSSESSVLRGYIETLLNLPWDKKSKDNLDIENAQKILDDDHYGLEKVKERMLEFLAVRSLTKKGDSPIICLVGPPGTGKTSIARSVAKALDKKYVRICLGGVRDEAEIRGHRRTYVGAMPGRIISGLKNAGVKNPLMLLDEIDKMSSDHRGDTASALLEVLDSEQNSRFVDHYVEIPVDLSEILFIATANSVSDIPRPLLDRMELIEVTSYTENEKVHIAKEHLIEKQKEKNGIKPEQLEIEDEALELIVRGYTKEAGVRNLERKISQICRKTARMLYQDKLEKVIVTKDNLEDFLGNEKYTYDLKNDEDEVGIVRGLAWTSVGGDTLQIEVNVMPGRGEIVLTGQLGDVMKESAKIGLSYIRSISKAHDIPAKFYREHDFHIHIPQGSVPKDGPSAGITMATALYSAITKEKVKCDVAMTGEITLRGRVLPIGGLKEKILAAKNAGIKKVLVPKKNESDIMEISDEIKDGLNIVYVETMEEVLKEAL